MKSSTFDSKPHVRFNTMHNLWVCTWYDPCRTGRYAKQPYWGMGGTMQEAMEKCQRQYLMISMSDDHSNRIIQQCTADNEAAEVEAKKDKRKWLNWWRRG